MYYAIQIIGYGKRQRFIISQVIPGKGTNPTNGKNYPTEEAAREAAAAAGYKIKLTGDYWKII